MLTRLKLSWVLSLSVLTGAVSAHGSDLDAPPPPPPQSAALPALPAEPAEPAGPDDHHPVPDADIQAQLNDAQKRLEEAANKVGELSLRLGARQERHTVRFGPALSGTIIGVVLDTSGGKGGVRIIDVSPGGPAAQAGVHPDDVIVSVNGKDVTGENSAREVTRLIHQMKPDDKLPIRVLRDGMALNFTVTTRMGPDTRIIIDGKPVVLPDIHPLRASYLVDGPLSNMELASLSPRLGKYFGADKGVLVVRAPPDGVFKLEDGDVILSIDGREPTSGSHATRILGSYQPGEKITLKIVRERKTMDLQTTLPEGLGRVRKSLEYRSYDPDIEIK